MDIFRSILHVFFFFYGLLDWIMLILVWFVRSFYSAQVSWQSCPGTLHLMTSQVVEGMWNCMGGYSRWFRGDWVDITMHTVNKAKVNIKYQKKATLIVKSKSKVQTSWSHFGISGYLKKIGPIGNFAWTYY